MDIALVLSIIAIVLTVFGIPGSLQATFGGPRLAFEWKEIRHDASVNLQVRVTNVPETRMLLRNFVRREPAQEARMTFEVFKGETRESMQSPFPPLTGFNSTTIHAGAAATPFTLVLAVEGKPALTNPEPTVEGRVLDAGVYRCEVVVQSGNLERRVSHSFIVGKDIENTKWT